MDTGWGGSRPLQNPWVTRGEEKVANARCPRSCRHSWGLVNVTVACYRDREEEIDMPITITITSGMLLAFFWAFWIFAFAGFWCGGGC